MDSKGEIVEKISFIEILVCTSEFPAACPSTSDPESPEALLGTYRAPAQGRLPFLGLQTHETSLI